MMSEQPHLFIPIRTLKGDGTTEESFVERNHTHALQGPSGNKMPLVVPSSSTTCLTPHPQMGEAMRVYGTEGAVGPVKQHSHLISPAEAFPARTGASPASAPASRARARGSSSTGRSGSQGSLFDQDGSCSRTSRDSYPLPTDATLESFSQRWANSGMAWPGAYSMLGTSESPSGAAVSSLSDILEESPDQRYALSARAAKGILRRANARGVPLPPELEDALERTAAPPPT